MESETEFLDLETDPFADLLQMTKGLNNTLPQGVRILESRVVPKKAPSLSGSISRYVYEVQVPEQYREGIAGEGGGLPVPHVGDRFKRRESRRTSVRCIESITAETGQGSRSDLHYARRPGPAEAAGPGRACAAVRHRAGAISPAPRHAQRAILPGRGQWKSPMEVCNVRRSCPRVCPVQPLICALTQTSLSVSRRLATPKL